jgi:putative sterol carrier protein
MTAKAFFLDELPAIIAEIERAVGDKAPKVNADLEFDVDGEGMYSVSIKNGKASVRRGGAAEPVVAMKFAKATWDEALAKIVRPQLAAFQKGGSSAAEAEAKKHLGGRSPVSPEQALAAVKALPLRVLLEVSGTAHKFELALAGAEEDDPTVTVSASEPDIEAVLSGALSPQEAFKTGKIKAKGAVATVMALMSRLFA